MDRFAIGPLLGAGGSAAVFRARDERTGDWVALKLMHGHLAADPVAAERFLAQARATLGLRHPRLATTLDLGRDGAVVWAAVALVNGVTASHLVETGGPLPVDEALRAAVAVLDGLAAAHARGVQHLDLSANNVMVPWDRGRNGADAGGAVVLDLGGMPHENGLLRVSPAFASPEVATGAPAGAPADVYSAGCLLQYLLTGRGPFSADSPQEVLEQHVRVVAEPPSAHVAGIPAAVDALVRAALVKDPGARPSAAELAAEAGAILARLASAPGAQAATRERPAVGEPATPVLVPAQRDGAAGPGRDRGGWLPSVRPVPPSVAATRPGAVHVVVGLTVLALLAALGASAASARSENPPSPISTGGSTGAASPAPTAATTPTAGPTAPARPTAVVPDQGDLEIDALTAQLVAAGLVPEVVTQDGPSPLGTVLGTDPTAGTPVTPGATVRVFVASGYAVVPDVAGLPPADASSRLTEAGLRPWGDAGQDEWVVAATNPRAGARVEVGSVVVLQGRVPPSASPAPTESPAPSSPPTVEPSAAPSPPGGGAVPGEETS